MAAPKTTRFPERDPDDLEEACLISESEVDFTYPEAARKGQKARNSLLVLPWILNIFFLSTTIYYMSKSLAKPADPSQISYSPAHEAVEFETKMYLQGFKNETSPYQGWPDDEKDELWQELYSKGVTLHIDENMHGRIPVKSEHIAIPGYESEYLVGLDVFHQLHCLNTIRKGFYPKRYNISFFKEDSSVDFMEWMHIDHCIESIRQSLTCNADISTNHYIWVDRVKHLKPRLDSVHTCKNFDKIRDWAFNRYVDQKNDRLHVENGKIIDYSYIQDPEGKPEIVPDNWYHTRDEFMTS